MKSAGKARSNGLYRHIRTSKEIIRNLLNDYGKYTNEYQIFTFINGTLLIKGVDIWGNPIEIDITSV